jgi:hypothetical protein
MRPAGAARAFARLLNKGLASRTEMGGMLLFKITEYGREMADQVKEGRPELHSLLRRGCSLHPHSGQNGFEVTNLR